MGQRALEKALDQALEQMGAMDLANGVLRDDGWDKYRNGGEVAFAEEVLGVRMWDGEKAIIEATFKHKKVTIRSGRKVGKTFTLGVLVCIFVSLYECIVVTIAPTQRQVTELLWGAVRDVRDRARSPLPGRCDLTQWKIGPKHYAIGFSTDRPDRIQGFHAGVEPPEDDPNRDLTEEELKELWEEFSEKAGKLGKFVLIVDEAPGVAQPILETAKGSVSGPNAYQIMAGNPTMDATEEHEFAMSHRPGSDYHRIKVASEPSSDPITADQVFDHVPNWLLPTDWIEARRAEWGEDSPLFKAHVLGQFAGSSSEARIITADMLVAADAAPRPTADLGRHLGVDVARFGSDSCVASLWVDGVKSAELAWGQVSTMVTVRKIEALRVRWGLDGAPIPGPNIHVDDGGVGGGVIDRLRERGIYIDAQDFGAGPEGDWPELLGEAAFVNRRAELHWILRRAFQEGMAWIPEKYAKSRQEAQWPEYDLRMTGGGTKILVGSKKDIKKAYGRSPDHFDADLLAWSRAGNGEIGFSILG